MAAGRMSERFLLSLELFSLLVVCYKVVMWPWEGVFVPNGTCLRGAEPFRY